MSKAKMPKAPSAEMGKVKEAPSSKKKAMPHETAPAGVSDMNGGSSMPVNSEMASMAPNHKPSVGNKAKGEPAEAKKPDSEGKLK